jgi:hypothetical protein
LYALGMFLSLNMNSKYKVFTYKSTMWADAAGYYMYLPVSIIYQWDYDALPAGIDTLTGSGFYLLEDKKVVFTKYTSGVSYLQLPFFLVTHAYVKLTNEKADGFSKPYVNAMLFSGVFYMLLGLFLLYFVLNSFFDKRASLFAVLGLVLCTNLYFYGIEHPGLSHVYSFFLAALLLYIINKYREKRLFLIIPLMALLVLIRPTNLLLVGMLLVFYFNRVSWAEIKKIGVKKILFALVLGFLVFVPQMFYWHYASGSWITYSYKGEGFSNWNSPKILEVLFAPLNGFLTYAPIFVLAFIGWFFYKPINKAFTFGVIALFLLLVYVNASWWSWQFGCAYGGRAFVDYYPFLAFGLAAFIQRKVFLNQMTKVVFALIFFVFVTYNILFIYGYDDCWYSTTWDYGYILNVLRGDLS